MIVIDEKKEVREMGRRERDIVERNVARAREYRATSGRRPRKP